MPTENPLPPRISPARARQLANPPKRPTAHRVAPSLRQTDGDIAAGMGRRAGQRMITSAAPPRYPVPAGYPKEPKLRPEKADQ